MGGQADADGQRVGWLGHLQKRVSVSANDTSQTGSLFDPPLRGLMAGTASGNVVVTLNGDDDTDVASKVTLALVVNVPETRFAIRKVWATSTTATGLVGFK